jgi:hypothetical protein
MRFKNPNPLKIDIEESKKKNQRTGNISGSDSYREDMHKFNDNFIVDIEGIKEAMIKRKELMSKGVFYDKSVLATAGGGLNAKVGEERKDKRN